MILAIAIAARDGMIIECKSYDTINEAVEHIISETREFNLESVTADDIIVTSYAQSEVAKEFAEKVEQQLIDEIVFGGTGNA